MYVLISSQKHHCFSNFLDIKFNIQAQVEKHFIQKKGFWEVTFDQVIRDKNIEK